ncbi:hypothetical protein TELCIR_16502 [Teladorsagia circumcincta]|uniref:Uncharacterized protein n=1 Tax=Teladorsagia circumcincta TaxID=45464 RepID=A0A2G9TVA6_TELCI|nr:hypothetical protein TELCIR_16502 [Teladorsagia circumcincta]
MPKKKGSKQLGLEDERFAHLRSDPKFSGLSNKEKKVTIGKRFAAALTDQRFSNKARVDKRGRPLRNTGGNLVDLYELEDSDEDEEEVMSPAKKKKDAESSHDEEEEQAHVGGGEEDDDRPIKLDLARGEGNVDSSSDDDSDSDWETNEDIQLEIDLAHLDQDAEQVEWSSSRIAACNLDWNLVHCEDLMVIAKSFTETKLAMRKYQVDQLRYYYAVIECDSVKTAEAIYNECDGYQFESSNVKMDLRFIPDDMEFDKDRIKEELWEGDVNVAKYKSKEKLQSAIAQTSARIGWDETEEMRSRKFAEAFNNEEGATDLIACSDSDDDSEVEKRRQALLSLLGSKEEVDGLEVDWDNHRINGASDEEEKQEEGEEEESDDDHIIDKKKENSDEEPNEKDAIRTIEPKKKEKNTYQAYLERKRAKKAERKQKLREMREKEREAVREVEGQAKAKQKESRAASRATKEKEDKDGASVEAVAGDERFKALFTDSAYAIEQSSKNYKGSKLIEKQVSAKRKAAEHSTKPDHTNAKDLVSKLKSKSAKWKR